MFFVRSLIATSVRILILIFTGVRLPRDDDLENEQERESSFLLPSRESSFLLPSIQSDDRDKWETSTEGEKLTTWQELIEIFQIALPTAMGNLSEFLPITFAMGMVGQMNVGGNGLQLDALAMANSYWNMTGLAVQYGLNSAMRTLCPQAVGSGRSRHDFRIYLLHSKFRFEILVALTFQNVMQGVVGHPCAARNNNCTGGIRPFGGSRVLF